MTHCFRVTFVKSRMRESRPYGSVRAKPNGLATRPYPDALVAQVMEQRPYASAPRVFWVVDNGSSHRGAAAAERLAARWPNLILVHLPVHASWLNQIEIVFSILQRKVLRPNTAESLFDLEDTILAFQERYQQHATLFQWKYTREDLARLMARLTLDAAPLALSA